MSSRAARSSLSPRVVRRSLAALFSVSVLALVALASDGSWKSKVSGFDRDRANPYAGQADAVAAGAKIFSDHCAKCHGADALGKGRKPSLRSDVVQQATDGELFWVLRNGILGKGMPSWSAIPEPSRWQVIAYVKSLGVANSSSAPPAANASPAATAAAPGRAASAPNDLSHAHVTTENANSRGAVE